MIALELVKDGKLFAYVSYESLVNRLCHGDFSRVVYSIPPSINYETNELVQAECLTITTQDLLSKKYREIDISKERLKELMIFSRCLRESLDCDYELLRKLYKQIREIEDIRYRLQIND